MPLTVIPRPPLPRITDAEPDIIGEVSRESHIHDLRVPLAGATTILYAGPLLVVALSHPLPAWFGVAASFLAVLIIAAGFYMMRHRD